MIRRQSPLHGYLLFLIEVAHRMRRGVGRRAAHAHGSVPRAGRAWTAVCRAY